MSDKVHVREGKNPELQLRSPDHQRGKAGILAGVAHQFAAGVRSAATVDHRIY